MALFELAQLEASQAGAFAWEESEEFLGRSGKVGATGENTELINLTMKRKEGGIAIDTKNEELRLFLSEVGIATQCAHILLNPPSQNVHSYLDQNVRNVQHPSGSTFTNKYGDLRGASAVKNEGG